MDDCKATKDDGEPCTYSAGPSGYCGIHDPLTDKQRAFVEEYLTDFNAAGAAKRAGYSENSAASIGHENLRKPDIREAIDSELNQRAMSADEALGRLSEMGRASMSAFVSIDDDGTPYIDLSTPEAKRALTWVRKIKINDSETKVELYDAQKALIKLLEVFGEFTDQIEHTHDISGGDIDALLGLEMSSGEQ